MGVQGDSSTTAMLVTSPEPSHPWSTTLLSAEQTTSTTTTERSSSEPVQDDEDLSTMPEADDELANFLMEMDEDGDGLLTYDELLVHLENEDEEMEGFLGLFLPVLQQYFLEADKDGDSKLDPEELAVLAQRLDEPENHEAWQEGEKELEDGSVQPVQDDGYLSTMPEA